MGRMNCNSRAILASAMKGDICMETLLLLLPLGPDYENLLQSNGDRMSCL